MKKFWFSLLCLFLPFTGIYSQAFHPDLFVFEDGLWNAKSKDAEYWVNLVYNAGFAGMELNGLDRADELIPELKKKGLRAFTVYIKIDLDAENPYDDRLKSYITKWNGEIPYIWMHVHSEKYKPSDPAGDARCIKIIRDLADFAKPTGLKLAFYPHTDNWVEKVTDGVRLSKEIDRDNVGTVFNLCHFLKADDPSKLEQRLDQAMPYLFLVSINGADDGPTHEMGWDRLIQPLGKGNYDVLKVLQLLKDKGYKGPVGLQCYNIAEKPEEFLKFSVKTWQKYMDELNNSEGH